MPKTILIPIDFSIESLNTLKYALEHHKQEKIKVVLMFAQTMSSSITELLFYSPAKIIRELSNPRFKDAIDILRNTYESNIVTFRIELFHGTNKNTFLNFCEGNEIDLIYIPKNYTFLSKNKAFDPIPMIKKSKLPFVELNWNTEKRNGNSDELNQLFI
jgi:Universal stress protein family